VTHNINFLPEVDNIVVMKDGVIAEMGSFYELLNRGDAFAGFLKTYGTDTNRKDEGIHSNEGKMVSHEFETYHDTIGSTGRKRAFSTASTNFSTYSCDDERSVVPTKNNNAIVQENDEQLIEIEQAAVGSVKSTVYLHYISSMGFGIFGFSLCMYIFGQCLHVVIIILLKSHALLLEYDKRKRLKCMSGPFLLKLLVLIIFQGLSKHPRYKIYFISE